MIQLTVGLNEDRAEFMAARFKLGFVVGFQGSGAGGRSEVWSGPKWQT